MKHNLTFDPMIRRVHSKGNYKGEIIEYQAYYESDAIYEGIEYIYWRDIDTKRRGKFLTYVISDDGIVFPVIGIGSIDGAYVLRSPFGNFILPVRRKTEIKLIFLPENRAGNLETVSKCSDKENALKTTVAVMAAHGMTRKDIVDALCIDTRGISNRKVTFINKFLGSEECSIMIREEVRQVLQRVGLTEETVIRNLVKAYDLAASKQDVSNMNRSVETMIDLFGLTEKDTTKQTKQLELTSETTDLHKLESVKDTVKLTQIEQA